MEIEDPSAGVGAFSPRMSRMRGPLEPVANAATARVRKLGPVTREGRRYMTEKEERGEV